MLHPTSLGEKLNESTTRTASTGGALALGSTGAGDAGALLLGAAGADALLLGAAGLEVSGVLFVQATREKTIARASNKVSAFFIFFPFHNINICEESGYCEYSHNIALFR